MADKEIKVGVYVAADEEITSSLDMEALEKVANGEMKATIYKTHENISSPEGSEMIRADIRSEEHTSELQSH